MTSAVTLDLRIRSGYHFQKSIGRWFVWFSQRKKCCCEELRKELKQRFDTVDYGMVRILNLLNEIERREIRSPKSITNDYEKTVAVYSDN